MSKIIVHLVNNETIEISSYDEMEYFLDSVRCNKRLISLSYPNVIINLDSLSYAEIIG